MKEDLKFKNKGELGWVMSYELRFYTVVGKEKLASITAKPLEQLAEVTANC